MNEKEVVQRAVEYLQGYLDDDINVRTEGGGDVMDLPCVILSWSTDRLDRLHGHNPWAGPVKDSNGNIVGQELHVYHEMRLDCWIKTYDNNAMSNMDAVHGESGRDELVDDVQSAFILLEADSDKFHKDAYEFQVRKAISGSRPEEEPNWYETDQAVTFRYLKRVIDSDVDTIEGIDVEIDSDCDISYTVGS